MVDTDTLQLVILSIRKTNEYFKLNDPQMTVYMSRFAVELEALIEERSRGFIHGRA